MKELLNLVTESGFLPGNQSADFGTVVPYAFYFTKKAGNGHFLYLTLVSYDTAFIGRSAEEISHIVGSFVEALAETYLAPKNLKRPKGELKLDEAQKRGHAALSVRILRSEAEVRALLAEWGRMQKPTATA